MKRLGHARAAERSAAHTARPSPARVGRLRWHVETVPLHRANEALDRLRRGRVLGRLVLVP